MKIDKYLNREICTYVNIYRKHQGWEGVVILEDNFSVTLYDIIINQIKFKYSNIDNKRPYAFDFNMKKDSLILESLFCRKKESFNE